MCDGACRLQGRQRATSCVTTEDKAKCLMDYRFHAPTLSFPVPALKHNNYWPTTGRVDNVWGDRNLSCTCVPVADYA